MGYYVAHSVQKYTSEAPLTLNAEFELHGNFSRPILC